MIISNSFLPSPGRLWLPGCAIAAGLLSVAAPTFAAPTASATVKIGGQPDTLAVGKNVLVPLLAPWSFEVEAGAANVVTTHDGETLKIKALGAGPVRIRFFAPDGRKQWFNLNVVEGIQTRRHLQVLERAPLDGTTPTRENTGVVASPTSEQAPNSNLGAATTGGSAVSGVDAASRGIGGGAIGSSNASPANPFGALPYANPGALPNQTFGASPLSPSATTATTTLPVPLAPALPVLGAAPARATPIRTTPVRTTVPSRAPSTASNSGARNLAPQISPSLPPPLASARANVAYRTTADRARAEGAGASKSVIDIPQGLAKFFSFSNNVLAVFFSDPNVMDARALNARTIAITGIGGGSSTLAIFTSRYPGDAVGKANIYRIQTLPRGGQTAIPVRDARTVERAINLALGDPRVRASVIKLEDGSIATRLAGTVRNEAEVQAAISTASFYVPRDRVVSSLYADINSPTLDAVLASGTINNTPESGLQENLRRITGNRSIELVSLPTGLAFKAEVNSVDEAQSLLRVLPSLNQQVIPFIVIRGQDPASSPYYNSTVPILNGEDRQLTQKLHDVTGVTTVYAVRASSNGLACYGTVRTRTEYNTVRRFMLVMAQSSSPPAQQGTSQGGATLRPQGGEGPFLPANDISGGYGRNLGLQMFVRITDPGQSSIRKVTVETSIVEISRTALKNLGVELGSVGLLGQTVSPTTVTAGATTVVNGQTQTAPPIVIPGQIQRTIDPTFTPGSALAGNGFVGLEGFQNLNPIRVRLNALVTNGDARILSRPNVSAIEGAAAQITIGGERPVPKAVATQGAVGTQIEFRRFGVIISMRPTVTGDNTILLQIRADVTQPDRTFEINVGGALIPGESVRSVDTTINVRPGDTVVMGGLITNEKRQQLSKVPILGDLPIIGSLFRSKRFDNNETELAIFMSPRIEAMPADMEAIEEMNRVPALPPLPSREESNGILFQQTARSSG